MSLTKKIILIAGTLLCLLGLSYFIYSVFISDSKESMTVSPVAKLKAPAVKVQAAGARLVDGLNSQLKQLQVLDEKYISLLTDSSTAIAALDSLQAVISNTEKNFQRSIDSIGFDENAMSAEEMLPFKAVLNNRRVVRVANSFERYNVVGNLASDEKEVEQIEIELFRKNARILQLEDLLAKKTSGPDGSAGAAQAADIALKLMQERYSTLEQQNSGLQRKLAEAESKLTAVKNPARLVPEEKLTELEAALRLAEVECNLTRADGRSIIYNSKQRKALLQESLTILNGLSGSANTAVQQQVKDKMTELKNIASMIRD